MSDINGGRLEGRGRWRAWMVACLGVILCLVVISGCGGSSDSDDSSSGESLPDGETFTIGWASDQTGPYAFVDDAMAQGIDIAVDQVNADGGLAGKWPVEVDRRDCKGEAAVCTTVTRELLDDDVQFLMGPSESDTAVPAAQLAAAAKIPIVPALAGTATFPSKVPDDYGFLFNPGTLSLGAAIAEYAYDQGYKTAWTVASPDIDYTQSIGEVFNARFEELGGEIVGESQFAVGDRSFRTIATEISNADPPPDVIMPTTFLPDTATFLRDLERVNNEIPILINDGNDSTTVFDAGPQLENTTMLTLGGETAGGEGWNNYLAEYRKEYGEDPEALEYEASGWDFIMMLNAAVTAADSTDGTAIRDAMIDLDGAPGEALGNTKFEENILVKPWAPVTFDLANRELIADQEPLTPEEIPDVQ